MSIFRALGALFAPPKRSSAPDSAGIHLYFRCNRCGAAVHVRANRFNDLDRTDEQPGVYVLHKDVMDSRCYQLMRAVVYLDSSYQVVSADVDGGKVITNEEYEKQKQTT